MRSDVYFTDFRSRTDEDNKINKVKKLFDAAKFDNLVNEDELVAVKLHFGEEGNDSYINPVLVRQVVDKIASLGCKTLYNRYKHPLLWK